MTYLAVPINVETPEQALSHMRQAVAHGAELLELRIDYLIDSTVEKVRTVVGIARKLDCPVIVTCRPSWEGGLFSGTSEHRLDLLAEAVQAGCDYLDVELLHIERDKTAIAQIIAGSHVKMIVSFHDFNQLPEDSEVIMARIGDYNPTVRKLAYMAKTIQDTFPALDMMYEQQAAGNESVVLAMGEAGILTRLLARKLGAFVSFASLSRQMESAPGQITLGEIKNLYQWDRLNESTRVYGLMGHPVGHSLSPAIHNASFAECDFPGLYLPLDIADGPESFRAFMEAVRLRPWLGFRGFSVTIPHKEQALAYVQASGGRVEPLAERIGAINTIVVEDDGRLYGANTDYCGALDAITDQVGITRESLKKIPAAVIGAGGVARAVVAGLTDVGAKVTIYNRTLPRAKELAEQFDADYAPLSAIPQLQARLLVNCTSLGMVPDTHLSAIAPEQISSDMIVFDTVYNPAETLLLQQAAAAGATTVDGVSMFVNQAAAQFKLFTGQEPPLGTIRRIMEDRL